MDNKEFLSKEQCEALSELNYNGDYDFAYHATGELWERGKKDKKERFLPAPLKQQVLRWFRERYGYIPHIFYYDEFNLYDFDIYGGLTDKYDEYDLGNDFYDTYEEAEDGVINKLIEIAKQQDNG